ncbi:MAG: hypothetical protein J5556_07005 [Deltaproteobacteria bacterium]|nr:hypothetical protein [Deltaproteobacteria bacterium]
MDKSQIMQHIASHMGGVSAPSVTADDNGKRLGVVAGQWEAVPAELPAVSAADNGKKLGVSAGAWAAVPAELPAVSTGDNGKVLMVVEGVWAVASLPETETEPGDT